MTATRGRVQLRLVAPPKGKKQPHPTPPVLVPVSPALRAQAELLGRLLVELSRSETGEAAHVALTGFVMRSAAPLGDGGTQTNFDGPQELAQGVLDLLALLTPSLPARFRRKFSPEVLEHAGKVLLKTRYKRHGKPGGKPKKDQPSTVGGWGAAKLFAEELGFTMPREQGVRKRSTQRKRAPKPKVKARRRKPQGT